MAERLLFHDCSRFMLRRIDCPFRGLEDEPEETEKEPQREREQPEEAEEEREGVRIPIALPGRGNKRHERSRQREIQDPLKLPLLAVAKGEVREALERMRQLQSIGGLPSIPRIADANSPFGGRGQPEIIAALTAIAIAYGLSRLPTSSFAGMSRAVQTSERHVAKQFQRLGNAANPSQGRVGGFTVNAAADLRKALGFRKKFGGRSAGFDSFSETGFN